MQTTMPRTFLAKRCVNNAGGSQPPSPKNSPKQVFQNHINEKLGPCSVNHINQHMPHPQANKTQTTQARLPGPGPARPPAGQPAGAPPASRGPAPVLLKAALGRPEARVAHMGQGVRLCACGSGMFWEAPNG